ncbi:putative aminohydrolase SsnA [Thermoflexus sp.]|uniref:putative aminohydrolase SsnA n=1 Tax=Thermoflexus sp. TaxID=1969742 RepID=UPI002ADD56BC|nr:putative aminohydrolase SsnA [Thermoflexus sp.]
MTWLITHGRVCTMEDPPRVLEDGAIAIDGDLIAMVGTTAEVRARYPDAEALDAGGQLVLPGSICAHTHFYGAFARGMPLHDEPPSNFPHILRRLWWRLDRALDEKAVRLSALVCLIDAIRHGTTTLIDHHASPSCIDGSLDILAEAVMEAGLRACLCYEVTDRNGPDGARAGIEENVRFLRQVREWRAAGDPRGAFLAASFGLHAAFTVGPETMERAVAEARALEVGFHIHVAEDAADEGHSLTVYGVRTVERLAREGVLGPQTLCAHCVHVDEAEIRLLARTGSKISHQPRSNMNNAVGVAPVEAMRRAGAIVGLGNDGFSNNMFAEMKAAYLVHKVHARDPRVMGAEEVIAMAYHGNACIASLFWPHPVGVLSPGAYADIILLDYCPYTPLTAENLAWHLIFGIDGSHVTTTVCGGRVLMKDRQLLTLDEERIAAEARAYAPVIWERFRAIAESERGL